MEAIQKKNKRPIPSEILETEVIKAAAMKDCIHAPLNRIFPNKENRRISRKRLDMPVMFPLVSNINKRAAARA
ncbi:hypothetical protein AALB16_00945 [Lachnospiraceae bacterium 62-35]